MAWPFRLGVCSGNQPILQSRWTALGQGHMGELGAFLVFSMTRVAEGPQKENNHRAWLDFEGWGSHKFPLGTGSHRQGHLWRGPLVIQCLNCKQRRGNGAKLAFSETNRMSGQTTPKGSRKPESRSLLGKEPLKWHSPLCNPPASCDYWILEGRCLATSVKDSIKEKASNRYSYGGYMFNDIALNIVFDVFIGLKNTQRNNSREER